MGSSNYSTIIRIRGIIGRRVEVPYSSVMRRLKNLEKEL